MLQAKMKKRHLTMIAVGAFSFVCLDCTYASQVSVQVFSSGSALKVRGPAAILIGWIIMGVMLAIGEISILYPLSGGFAKRFLDPGFALAMGWNYFLQWAVVLPLEITAARTTVQYWTEKVFIAVWITVFWVVVMIICLFGTLDYAEEKFWSSCLKLVDSKSDHFPGFAFVEVGQQVGNTTATSEGLCGRIQALSQMDFRVFVQSPLQPLLPSPERNLSVLLLVIRETPDPRATMPGAVKGTFWPTTVIYITSLTITGLLVPWTNERLLGGTSAAASPFVIVLDNAKIPGLNRCCLCHIRFRRAWKVQGHSVEELLFKALGGVWGSWLGLILIVIVLIAPFHVALFSIGGVSGGPALLSLCPDSQPKSPLDTMRKGYDENKDLERQREEQRINDEALDAARAEQAKARTGVMQIEKKIKKGEKALDSKIKLNRDADKAQEAQCRMFQNKLALTKERLEEYCSLFVFYKHSESLAVNICLVERRLISFKRRTPTLIREEKTAVQALNALKEKQQGFKGKRDSLILGSEPYISRE
ncbi:amino acid permease-domain-containing protein [Lentinula guzmanii]|uniref:Amino acid permease-domain-containing protein n=1 Tax=Lentinula guzmanii TaxID=2804957 RepID=A0AA38J5Y8_9AGAR|nr:amino acid permease-domain-containing protein [Lentinula guzmanii]